MSHAWRIDTLDPRGGLSFASWREATLFDEGDLEDAPVFFIGAPTFAPRAVANRSVALAAERHGFQLGLLDTEGEAEFQTLDDVADFVRRLYLTSARGNPPEDGTPTPPPPPDDSPLDGGEPLIPLEPGPLTDAVATFQQRSKLLSRGQQRSFQWTEALNPSGRTSAPKDQLLRGAIILIREVLWRFPMSLKPQDLERWRQAASALASILWRLELRGDIQLSGELGQYAEDFLVRCWSKVEPGSHPHSRDYAVYAILNLLEGGSYDGPYHWPSHWASAGQLANPLEPMEILGRIPVPLSLAKAMKMPEPARATLATTLSVGLGDPAVFAAHADVEALVTLAAALVAAVDAPSVVRAWHRHEYEPLSSLTLPYRREQIMEAMRVWLARNLPARIFDPTLEAMISKNAAPATLSPDPASRYGGSSAI